MPRPCFPRRNGRASISIPEESRKPERESLVGGEFLTPGIGSTHSEEPNLNGHP